MPIFAVDAWVNLWLEAPVTSLPEGTSTPYLRPVVPKTIPRMALGIRKPQILGSCTLWVWLSGWVGASSHTMSSVQSKP